MKARFALLPPLLFVAAARAQDSAPAARADADAAEDRALRERVDRAVDAGIEWLRRAQADDGSFGDFVNSGGLRYRAGYTAIALFALLASNVNKVDPVIERGFRWLADHPAGLTYEIGLDMLAIDLRAAPLFERFEVERMDPAARRGYRFPRELAPADRERMAGYVEHLEKHRFRGLWRYGQYPTEGDTSNAQFAILGLKAAVRCGLKVDPSVWADTLDYFLRHQLPRGPAVKLPRYRGLGKDGRPEFDAMPALARGWAYEHGQLDESAVCGSRVCFGISTLLLCREELVRPGAGPAGASARSRQGKIDEAVRDGLAWLERNFSVTENPGAKDWHHTYLYALERVGALTGSRYVGSHDWYREGAEFLVRDQRPDGSWPAQGYSAELPNTCFALLFLRRSTFPVVQTGMGGR